MLRLTLDVTESRRRLAAELPPTIRQRVEVD
jgi:hypothetical protein